MLHNQWVGAELLGWLHESDTVHCIDLVHTYVIARLQNAGRMGSRIAVHTAAMGSLLPRV